MECIWHVPLWSTTQPQALAKGNGREGRAKHKHCSQESAEILAGMGTQRYFAAEKPHNTCQPGKVGDILLLSQKLWWNHSSQVNLVHFSLVLIFMHTFIPKLPASKVWPPFTGHALFIVFDSIFKSKAREFYTHQ